jgi:hypothetical protein
VASTFITPATRAHLVRELLDDCVLVTDLLDHLADGRFRHPRVARKAGELADMVDTIRLNIDIYVNLPAAGSDYD